MIHEVLFKISKLDKTGVSNFFLSNEITISFQNLLQIATHLQLKTL